MTTYNIGKHGPAVAQSAFVAKTATVSGNVILHGNSRVLSGAALQGDGERIVIGKESIVGEETVLHAEPGFPLTIERNVSIGHGAILVGCMVKEGTVIGMQAVIQDGAVVGANCVVAPGAVIKKGMVFPDNSLIVGAPAKILRKLKIKATIYLDNDAATDVEPWEDMTPSEPRPVSAAVTDKRAGRIMESA